METISLLGCGSLGFPLALDLLNEGYHVKGSTTTASKIYKLKQYGITPYLINIEDVLDIFVYIVMSSGLFLTCVHTNFDSTLLFIN